MLSLLKPGGGAKGWEPELRFLPSLEMTLLDLFKYNSPMTMQDIPNKTTRGLLKNDPEKTYCKSKSYFLLIPK